MVRPSGWIPANRIFGHAFDPVAVRETPDYLAPRPGRIVNFFRPPIRYVSKSSRSMVRIKLNDSRAAK
jgi:hypothetical protein